MTDSSSLCQVLGSEDFTRDPAFATNPDRVENRQALAAVLQKKLMVWCKAQRFAAFEQAVVPAGLINTIEEALADQQIVARGLQIAPEGMPGLPSPLRFSRSGLVLDRAAPQKS